MVDTHGSVGIGGGFGMGFGFGKKEGAVVMQSEGMIGARLDETAPVLGALSGFDFQAHDKSLTWRLGARGGVAGHLIEDAEEAHILIGPKFALMKVTDKSSEIEALGGELGVFLSGRRTDSEEPIEWGTASTLMLVLQSDDYVSVSRF